jgi:hypothetical protein
MAKKKSNQAKPPSGTEAPHHLGSLGRHMFEIALAVVTGVSEAFGGAVIHEPAPPPTPIVMVVPSASSPLQRPADKTPGAEPPLTPHRVTLIGARDEVSEVVAMPFYKPAEWVSHATDTKPAEAGAVRFDIETAGSAGKPFITYVNRASLLAFLPSQIVLSPQQESVLADLKEVKIEPIGITIKD